MPVWGNRYRGHIVVGKANANQHSIQLVTCGRQICLRRGRSWGKREERYVGGQLGNRLSMRQVNRNGVVTRSNYTPVQWCSTFTLVQSKHIHLMTCYRPSQSDTPWHTPTRCWHPLTCPHHHPDRYTLTCPDKTLTITIDTHLDLDIRSWRAPTPTDTPGHPFDMHSDTALDTGPYKTLTTHQTYPLTSSGLKGANWTSLARIKDK